MAARKPKPKPTGEERRASILDAALASFLERGYLATTISDIREASGAATGSIYHFFDGKGALAHALLEDAVAGWSAASAEAEDPKATAEQMVKASTAGLVTWGLKNPELFRFMDEIRTLSATAPEFAGIAETLAAGQNAGASRYAAFAKKGKVQNVPWPIAHSLMLGPAYNYLRLASSGAPRIAAKRATELLADAAWKAVKA